MNQHGNDFVFYRAVEPDSLIAGFLALLSFLSFGFRLPVRSNSLNYSRLNYEANNNQLAEQEKLPKIRD